MSDLDALTQADDEAMRACDECRVWLAQPPVALPEPFRLPPPPPPSGEIIARVHRHALRVDISHEEAVHRMWWAGFAGQIA